MKYLQHLGYQRVTMVIISKLCLLGWVRCPGGGFAVHIRLRRSPIGFAEFVSYSLNQPKNCPCFVWGQMFSDCTVQVHDVSHSLLYPCVLSEVWRYNLDSPFHYVPLSNHLIFILRQRLVTFLNALYEGRAMFCHNHAKASEREQ